MAEERAKSGVKGFDEMIEGGIPRGYSLIIQGPLGPEKDWFVAQFLKEGLLNGEAGIIALATIPPSRFRAQMRAIDTDIDRYEGEGLFKIIDWYSFNKEEITGVIEEGAVIKSSIDLTGVRMAFNKAIESIKEKGAPIRAVVTILSPALAIYDFGEIYDFTRILRAKFEKHGITALFLIERSTHDTSELSNLYQLFDGVVNIDKRRENGKLVREIEIISMARTFFDFECRPLTLKKNEIIVESVVEREEIASATEKFIEAVEKIAKREEEHEVEVERGPEVAKEEVRDDIKIILRQIEAEPRSPSPWFSLGTMLSSHEVYEEAVRAFDRVIKLEPEHSKAWNGKAFALSKLNRHVDAACCFREALKATGWELIGYESVEELQKVGLKRGTREILSRAEADFQDSKKKPFASRIIATLRKNPNDSNLWFSLGLMLSEEEKYESAILAFDEVIRINPNHKKMWNEKGISLSKLGRHEEATVCFQRALECYGGKFEGHRDIDEFVREVEERKDKLSLEKELDELLTEEPKAPPSKIEFFR